MEGKLDLCKATNSEVNDCYGRHPKSICYDSKCKIKLSADISVTGLAQASSNSMTILADKVAIFEIKTNQPKKQKKNPT